MDNTTKQRSDGPEENIALQIPEKITIHVHPTTGGEFPIEISPYETADELRRRISRRFQTPKERLKVLFKEQVLEGKQLKDYRISDGSKVTLLPSVESGFSSTVQGTQQSIIQAIESLSDPQIDDFLSGRLPLTLALRVGDHMMFVQLQLEQSQGNSQGIDARSSRSHRGGGSSNFCPVAQSSQRSLSPRLIADMSAAAPLETASVLPEEFPTKKLPASRTRLGPLMAEPVSAGPAPKVPKLAVKSDATTSNRDRMMSSVVHKSMPFRQHHSAPSSPDELPYAMFNQPFDSLQQITQYNQIASCINHYHHHPQSGANHLHRLVTACSSLEQVVAIPPPASNDPVKIPGTVHENLVPRRSSRKRASTSLTSSNSPTNEVPQQASHSKCTYAESISNHDVPSTAAFIQNALMHHSLNGFRDISMISSAYAKYQASRVDPNQMSPQTPSPPASQPAEIKLKHPIATNMLQASSSTRSSSVMQAVPKHHSNTRSERHHHYHRRSSANGRLTSGSSSHHSSGFSGNRVARQMQRLRRLCGSHQQCVAYSSRELASEISSIVHMARHHSRSDCCSHRKMHKVCRECHVRDKVSTSRSAHSGPSIAATSQHTGVQASGACIDSFTTHGPGIFSGTFSGSLHPSIQDPDGKPKRDPKTILQILTDLLNATQQYQGQLGNVGLLPQLFKDHFKNESSDTKTNDEKARSQAKKNADEFGKDVKQQKLTPRNVHHTVAQSAPAYQQKSDRRTFVTTRNNKINDDKYTSPAASADITVKQPKLPPRAQYLTSVSTIPLGNIPMPYAPRHSSSRSSRRNSPNHDGSSKHHRHHHSRHPQYYKHHHGAERCCSSLNCRRLTKQQLSINALNAKRENENTNTKNKMKELMEKMKLQRQRRLNRRSTNKACTRRVGDNIFQKNAEVLPDDSIIGNDSAPRGGEMHGKVKVPFDDITEYEIKEVGHESAETVTV